MGPQAALCLEEEEAHQEVPKRELLRELRRRQMRGSLAERHGHDGEGHHEWH